MMVKPASIALCVVFGLTMSVSGQVYVLTDLGTLGGAPTDVTETHAINNSGQIVGYSTDFITLLPFTYQNGTMTALGTLGGAGGSATALNNRGQIVGYAQIQNNEAEHAFLYDKGVMTDLGIDSSYSAAYGINERGQVVGQYLHASGYLRGFKYSKGATVDLGTLGGNYTQAFGINSAGQITGNSETASSTPHAFLYEHGVMQDVGTLGGSYSQGAAINDVGLVVGSSTLPGDSDFRAFAYAYGMIIDLGSLGGSSLALGVNNAGDVVGSSFTAPGQFDDLRPVLYRNGEVVDLSGFLPGWSFMFARSINARGEIVGDGNTPNGERHGFLLTPLDP